MSVVLAIFDISSLAFFLVGITVKMLLIAHFSKAFLHFRANLVVYLVIVIVMLFFIR